MIFTWLGVKNKHDRKFCYYPKNVPSVSFVLQKIIWMRRMLIKARFIVGGADVKTWLMVGGVEDC